MEQEKYVIYGREQADSPAVQQSSHNPFVSKMYDRGVQYTELESWLLQYKHYELD